MRKQFSKITLTAGFVLALAFTFSCSSDGDDGGDGTSSGGNVAAYEPVVIGGQTWMSKNLAINVPGAKCYGENGTLPAAEVQANCVKYGRLYDWSTAMALPASCNSSSCASRINTPHRGICPSGWHIPSNADWNVLMKTVNPSCSDNSNCAGAGLLSALVSATLNHRSRSLSEAEMSGLGRGSDFQYTLTQSVLYSTASPR